MLGYKHSFGELDLDILWDKYDHQKLGRLDRKQTLAFIQEVGGYIEDQLIMTNFNIDEFNSQFDRFDEDNSGTMD